MDRRVAFVGVGVQKGGTSALRNMLRRSSGIDMPRHEVHFFDQAAFSADRANFGAYEQAFPSDAGLKGEVTPNYSYWPGSLERIARYRSDMKIIFLLRDRVERAWSQWRMHHRKGQELAPFGWAIREGRSRVPNSPGSRDGAHPVFSYVERGFYAPQVARAFQLFGRERVLLLLSADLAFRPHAAMEQVGSFLGVPIDGPALQPRRINVTPDRPDEPALAEEDMVWLRECYCEDEAELAALAGVIVPIGSRLQPSLRPAG